MGDSPSNDLLLRARYGDPGAFELFYERHHKGVFRYLYYRLGNIQAAEDMAAETFLRLISALPNYRPLGMSPQAWVYQIARNLSIDHFRHNRIHEEMALEEQTLSDDDDPPAEAEKHLNQVVLQKALDQLGEDQREVIVLRFISGLHLAETAQTLNRSEDAVKGLQHRALMALRKILSDGEVGYA